MLVAMVLLNVDAGELADEPEELYRVAELVNVACGGHAGDEASMSRVVAACRAAGTRVGAHPSYPDRVGFGRRTLDVDDAALARSIEQQCTALAAVARRHGVRVGWAKLHGALYHDAQKEASRALAVLGAVKAALGADVAVVGPPSGATRDAAAALGLPYLREAFADRGVRADGTLVPRGEPGALVTDPAQAAARARELAANGACDTVCVHGDSPGAVEIARAVREALAS
jgi:UPF0271 protein